MSKNPQKLVGQTAHIKEGWGSYYEGHWGIIQMFDGHAYHIGGGSFGYMAVIFDREEFVIHRMKKGRKK